MGRNASKTQPPPFGWKGVLQSEVFGPGTPGQRLWENGTVSRLLAAGPLSAARHHLREHLLMR